MKWRDLPTGYADRPEVLRTLSPHEVLQVAENAPIEEVKAAYRRLAKLYHPDRSHEFMQGSNAEVLKILNDAHEALVKRTPPAPPQPPPPTPPFEATA
ncbi:MAG TPA: DnaJ domain-containing protein [Candidatus Limnocylindria bacterium]|jgi:DnaJ-class molecular chaperone|nr:DnaJ domain-containing protein [Candidatus Limnocylindria bacterium]